MISKAANKILVLVIAVLATGMYVGQQSRDCGC
jgi:hypothetical protein